MKTLTAFEHQELKAVSPTAPEAKTHLTPADVKALAKFYEKEPRYFSITAKGIRLKQWVGLLRVGKLQLEVLPKLAKEADPGHHEDWRNLLLDMLLRSRLVNFHRLPKSQTGTRNNILDLLLWHYTGELQTALHQGLIKRYRKVEGNLYALKGKLLFSRHLRHNIVHQERFYTAHTIYNFDHALNQILSAALCLIPSLTQNANLRNRAQQLALEVPAVSEVAHPLALFKKVKQDRKSAPFEGLLILARLILEHHHPKLSAGDEETFSLMFDMNRVFEEWLKVELNAIPGVTARKRYLQFLQYPDKSFLRGEPDLVVQFEADKERVLILDAKWKLIQTYCEVSIQDLRQVYAYLNLLDKAIVGGLVFPAAHGQSTMLLPQSQYLHRHEQYAFKCALGLVAVTAPRAQGSSFTLSKASLREWLEAFTQS